MSRRSTGAIGAPRPGVLLTAGTTQVTCDRSDGSNTLRIVISAYDEDSGGIASMAAACRVPRSTSLRARNASLGPSRLRSSSATATPPAFGERARKHRPASHAPLAYARSLSASGMSGLRAHVATPADIGNPFRSECTRCTSARNSRA
jgi:hypothetical protein